MAPRPRGRDGQPLNHEKELAKLAASGVDLAGLGVQPRIVVSTMHSHLTIFQNTAIGIGPSWNEEQICDGFLLIIQDEADRHEYRFPFEVDIKNELLGQLMRLPDVGTRREDFDAEQDAEQKAADEEAGGLPNAATGDSDN